MFILQEVIHSVLCVFQALIHPVLFVFEALVDPVLFIFQAVVHFVLCVFKAVVHPVLCVFHVCDEMIYNVLRDLKLFNLFTWLMDISTLYINVYTYITY